MINTELNTSIACWDAPVKESYIKINISRRTLTAFTIALLIHAGVLFFARNFVVAKPVGNPEPKVLNIRIAGLPAKKISPIPVHKVILTRKYRSKTKTSLHPLIAVQKSATPVPVAPPNTDNNAPTDLMAYIKAKRQQAQEDNAAFDTVTQPSADEQRDATIKRNLQKPGTNGVFQIRRLAYRTAQFSFRGWKNNYDNSRLELIDVETGADNQIELAVVKKMIEIIRREYKGDFRWDSQRVGRILVLSARMEDNSGLESFLMQEFFESNQRAYPILR